MPLSPGVWEQMGTGIGSFLGNWAGGARQSAVEREVANLNASGADLPPEEYATALQGTLAKYGLTPGARYNAAVTAHATGWQRKKDEATRAGAAGLVGGLFPAPNDADYLQQGGSFLTQQRRMEDVTPSAEPVQPSASFLSQDWLDSGLQPVAQAPSAPEWVQAEGFVPLSATRRAADRYAADDAERAGYRDSLSGAVKSGVMSFKDALEAAKDLRANRTKEATADQRATATELANERMLATARLTDERTRALADEKLGYLRDQLGQRLTELGQRLDSAETIARARGDSAETVAEIRRQATEEAARIRAEAQKEAAKIRAEVQKTVADKKIAAAGNKPLTPAQKLAEDARYRRWGESNWRMFYFDKGGAFSDKSGWSLKPEFKGQTIWTLEEYLQDANVQRTYQAGKSPAGTGGAPSAVVTPPKARVPARDTYAAAAYLKKAKDRGDVLDRIRQLNAGGWSREELAAAVKAAGWN